MVRGGEGRLGKSARPEAFPEPLQHPPGFWMSWSEGQRRAAEQVPQQENAKALNQPHELSGFGGSSIGRELLQHKAERPGGSAQALNLAGANS